MPNIEIFGYDRSDPVERKASTLFAEKIQDAMKDAPYRSEVVLTFINSASFQLPNPGGPMPERQYFVRIWATTQEAVDDVVARLEPLDIDIEDPPLLRRFIEKRSAATAG